MPPCTESCTECMSRAGCGTGAGAAQQRDCYVSRLYECVCARVCEGCIYCAFEHVQVYLCVCRILNENLNVKVTRRLEPSHAESVLQLLLLLLDLLQLPSSKEKNVKRTQ